MSLQLFIGQMPLDPARIKPVANGVEHGGLPHKPSGGLWTSTWLPNERTSGWVEWCRFEQPDWIKRRRWVLLAPKADARVYQIDSLRDLQALHREYGYLPERLARAGITGASFRALDFERMAEDGYDGLHLTERGQWRTRLSEPNLYAWDCESTCWFRWAFTDMREIEPPINSSDDEHDGQE